MVNPLRLLQKGTPMPRSANRALPALLSTAVALLLGACGSSTDGGGTSTSVDDGGGVHRGGTLTVLTSQDVSSLDPGITYQSLDLNVLAATVRTLYSYAPTAPDELVPDLAAAEPQITDGGKTLTVRLRRGVRFGPPVDREVTSRDVKYAIERGFDPNVANGYASTYYG